MNMPKIEPKYLKLKVTAGARRQSIEEKASGMYAISVKEPAEENLANRAALLLLAQKLGLPSKSLRLVRGHRSPSKLIEVKTS